MTGAMVETRQERSPISTPIKCLYVPGIKATNSRIHAVDGIGEAFAREYGGWGNVKVYNSAVSTDESNPKRFSEMADQIRTQARQGPLDVVALSLGVTEIWRALRIIHWKDRKFFKDPAVKRNLRFVLIGPSGFSPSLKDTKEYKSNVDRLLAKDTIFDGITVFPPEDISSEQLRQPLRDTSNMRDGIRRVPFDEPSKADRYLEESEKEELAGIDESLAEALLRNDELARELLEDRGVAVKRGALQAAHGDPNYIPNEEEAKRGLREYRLLIRALGGKPMQEFRRLAEDGFTVDFVVPEYDYVVPIEKVMQFFDGINYDSTGHIQVVEQTSHAGPSLQADLFARTIRQSRLAA